MIPGARVAVDFLQVMTMESVRVSSGNVMKRRRTYLKDALEMFISHQTTNDSDMMVEVGCCLQTAN